MMNTDSSKISNSVNASDNFSGDNHTDNDIRTECIPETQDQSRKIQLKSEVRNDNYQSNQNIESRTKVNGITNLLNAKEEVTSSENYSHKPMNSEVKDKYFHSIEQQKHDKSKSDMDEEITKPTSLKLETEMKKDVSNITENIPNTTPTKTNVNKITESQDPSTTTEDNNSIATPKSLAKKDFEIESCSLQSGSEVDSDTPKRKARHSAGSPAKRSSAKRSLSFKKLRDSYELKCNNEKNKDNKNEMVVLRNQMPINSLKKNENRISYMMKTKGTLYYKKKCTFSKWKSFYVVLDDFKMQMNFFKSEEDYTKLSGCKMVIDLRFVSELKPQKPGILQGNFPFKLTRRAGLSTVKLASVNEVERAKWITTIEGILKMIQMTLPLDPTEKEKIAQVAKQELRSSSDSGTTTSINEQENQNIIQPKKISVPTSFIKLNSNEISNLKLKRISSEKSESRTEREIEKEDKVDNQVEDNFDPQKKFGVNLRKVNTVTEVRRNDREQSPEYIELKQKFNSLSLTRSAGPKLPFSANLSRSYVGESIIKHEQASVERKHSPKTKKESTSKRCPSPKLPISKSVESVLKDKDVNDSVVKYRNDEKLTLNVCHATSTIISFEESSLVVESDKNTTSETQKLESNEAPDKVNFVISTDKENDTKIPDSEQLTKNNTKTYVNCTVESKEEPEITEKPDVVQSDENNDYVGNKMKEDSSNDGQKNDIVIKPDFSELQNDDLDKIIIRDKEEINSNDLISSRGRVSKSADDLKLNPESQQTKLKALKLPVPGMMSQKQMDNIVFGKDRPISDSSCSQKRNSDFFGTDNRPHDNPRFSIYSFQSQTSTESDEPLPRLNFLGKSESPACYPLTEEFNFFKEKKENPTVTNEFLETSKPEISQSEATFTQKLNDDTQSTETNNSSFSNEDSQNITTNISAQLNPTILDGNEIKTSDCLDDDSLAIRSNKENEKITNTPDIELSDVDITKPTNEHDESKEYEKELAEALHLLENETKDFLSFENNNNIQEGPGKDSKIDDELSSDVELHQTDVPDEVNNTKEENKSIQVSNEAEETQSGQISNLENSDIFINNLEVENGSDSMKENITEQDMNVCAHSETASSNVASEFVELKQENSLSIEHSNLQDIKTLPDQVEHLSTAEEDKKDFKSTTTWNQENENENKIKLSPNLTGELPQLIDNTNVSKEGDSEPTLITSNSNADCQKDDKKEEDFFPAYGEIEYRLRGNVLDDSSMRTSGIIGLKKFLSESEDDDSNDSIRPGISKLGHSSAVEKLKKEIP